MSEPEAEFLEHLPRRGERAARPHGRDAARARGRARAGRTRSTRSSATRTRSRAPPGCSASTTIRDARARGRGRARRAPRAAASSRAGSPIRCCAPPTRCAVHVDGRRRADRRTCSTRARARVAPEPPAPTYAERRARRPRPPTVDRRAGRAARSIRVAPREDRRACSTSSARRCSTGGGSSTCSAASDIARRRGRLGRARSRRAAARRAEGRRDRDAHAAALVDHGLAAARRPRHRDRGRARRSSSSIERRRDRARPRHPRGPLRAARPPAAERRRPRHRDARTSATRRGQAARADASSCAPSSAAALVEIVVSDDGRGVSQELLAQAQHGRARSPTSWRAPGSRPPTRSPSSPAAASGSTPSSAHVESFGGSARGRAASRARAPTVILRLPLDARAARRAARRARRRTSTACRSRACEEASPSTRRCRSTGGRRSSCAGARSRSPTSPSSSARAAPPLAAARAGDRRRRRRAPRRARRATACSARKRSSSSRSGRCSPRSPGYLGAAILGDGRIALLLDPAALTARAPRRRARRAATAAGARRRERLAPKVLVVEDSFTVRELQRSILEAAGYRVVTARDGREALEPARRDDEIDARRHRRRDAGDGRARADRGDPRTQRVRRRCPSSS